jgi:DNA-binding PucR family transcriptional regulator
MMTKHLAAAEAWSTELNHHHQVEIRVLAGTIWVTQESDPVDHVLEAPAVFTTDHAGRVAMQALTAADVAVEPQQRGLSAAA